MGYNTKFKGTFTFDKPLTQEHKQLFNNISLQRHENECMPSLYCQWVPNELGTAIIYNGKEKFYSYKKWIGIIVLLADLLGYKLNGKVFWTGEKIGDWGTITIKNNRIKIFDVLERKQNKEQMKNLKIENVF